MKVTCYSCNKPTEFPDAKLGRLDSCDHCNAYLHCCLMCDFYDKNSYNECKEPMADRITEKEKSNYCDYFKLNTGVSLKDEKNDLLAKANSLFKN